MAENMVALVFTDLVNSTAIKNNLPGSSIHERNETYRDTILLPHRQRVTKSLSQYEGRVVEEPPGDGFLLVFPNAILAAQWAVDIQSIHIDDPIPTPLGALTVKIGIHIGSPLAHGNQFIGQEVDYAARVEALATSEQILLSENAAAFVRSAQISGITLHSHGERHLKGIGSVPIFELLYAERPPHPLKEAVRPGEDAREILPAKPHYLREFLRTFGLSLGIAILTMGARYFGMLQGPEIAFFDYMMRSRPAETQDSRLLVVTIDEESLKYQDEQKDMPRQGSLSDRALILLLAKLKQYGARTIGLDIYRDATFLKADMAELLKQYGDRRLVVVCKVGEPDGSKTIAPPKGISLNSMSFSDIIEDEDGVVRRQLLQMETPPNSACTTEISLGLNLAARYLWETGGITPQINSEKYLQLGNTFFPRLLNHMGGYQKIDDRGYQILLNYRSPYNQDPAAQTVTLKQVLTGQINPESVKDRIVLIGVTDPSFRDYVRTPYSGAVDRSEMPGVVLQAQMVSHILSAVLDGRPSIWVWAIWKEFLWVCGWAVVGGALVWWLHRPLYLVLSGGASLLCLYGICFAIFLQAGWIPFVPAALALISAGVVCRGCVSLYSKMDRRKL